MNPEIFFKNLRATIQLDSTQTLTMRTRLKDIPTWDSIGMISVIEMLSQNYQVECTALQVESCIVVEDIFKLIGT